jgi:23S rRNA (cytosine1962-C5)-methyltransferase
MRQILLDAFEKRASIRARGDTDAYRLLHGWSEGLPGIEIEALGPVALVVCKSADPELLPELSARLVELLPFTEVVCRQRGHRPEKSDAKPKELVVKELGVSYAVEPQNPRHHGLYLDARPAREWLLSSAKGLRVANLFSFAGSLGVAALAGGALSSLHVDSQKRALRRCRANHELNEQTVDARDLVCEDVFKWLKQSAKGRARFGGIIIDPPPTAGRSPAQDLERSVGLARGLMEPGGWLLVFLHRGQQVPSIAGMRLIWEGTSGIDFPESEPARKVRFAALSATL